jgi:hypothetical protein
VIAVVVALILIWSSWFTVQPEETGIVESLIFRPIGSMFKLSLHAETSLLVTSKKTEKTKGISTFI